MGKFGGPLYVSIAINIPLAVVKVDCSCKIIVDSSFFQFCSAKVATYAKVAFHDF